MIALCQRFASLDHSSRRLVLEVAVLMVLVWAGLRFLPFPTLRGALDYYVRLRTRTVRYIGADADAVDRVRWAIRIVAARLTRATCLVQALTADAVLRRMGLTCELRIGVRTSAERIVPIEAHAWVDCNGLVVVGAIDDLSDFKVMVAPRSA